MHYKDDLIDDFKNIIETKLRYQDKKLINYDDLENHDLYNTYVLPIFLRPGRTHFFIRDAYDKNEAANYKYGMKRLLPH